MTNQCECCEMFFSLDKFEQCPTCVDFGCKSVKDN